MDPASPLAYRLVTWGAFAAFLALFVAWVVAEVAAFQARRPRRVIRPRRDLRRYLRNAYRMTRPPTMEQTMNDLPTAEAQVDRLQQEVDRLRGILGPLAQGIPSLSSAPSHVTRAMAARIAKTDPKTVQRHIDAGRVGTATHWGTVLLPMSEVLKLVDLVRERREQVEA